MRLDPRPTLPEIEPAFRAYSGEALRPFLAARRVTEERLVECAELALAGRDTEGLRLARLLVRLSPIQRQALKRDLTDSRTVS